MKKNECYVIISEEASYGEKNFLVLAVTTSLEKAKEIFSKESTRSKEYAERYGYNITKNTETNFFAFSERKCDEYTKIWIDTSYFSE